MSSVSEHPSVSGDSSDRVDRVDRVVGGVTEWVPAEEVRFAVVLYGGVSLAIYINGVVQEMMHLVRSTATAGGRPCSDASLTPLQRVYRELALSDPAEDGSRGLVRRFIVDIISGTSAGGINGVFLAKGLANDLPIDGLQRMWIEQGDIGKLINDEESVADLRNFPYDRAKRRHRRPRPTMQSPARQPQSLLNGDRMYLKLLDALDGMDASSGGTCRLAEEIDLYVTATDLHGKNTPIALSDGLAADELVHKRVFHFHKDAKGIGDFGNCDNPFLAFAARCTSSFPVAFEPMSLGDIYDALEVSPHGTKEYCDPLTSPNPWHRFYHEFAEDDEFAQMCFGDGGYLDNKPFSFAVQQLATRHADVHVDRKLIFVDPGPETHAEKAPGELVRKPDALDAAVKGFTLPCYETIREDLTTVAQRNFDVERVRRIVDKIAAGARIVMPELDGLTKDDLLEHWRHVRNDWQGRAPGETASLLGPGYRAYERLKVSAVSDDLMALVVKAFGLDPASGYARAMRELTRLWREREYPWPAEDKSPAPDDPSPYTFLLAFDTSYRLRRLDFLAETARSRTKTDGDGERSSEEEARAFRHASKRLRDPRCRLESVAGGQWMTERFVSALLDRVVRPRTDENAEEAGERRRSALRRLQRELEFVLNGSYPAEVLGHATVAPRMWRLDSEGMQMRAEFVLDELGRRGLIEEIATKVAALFRQEVETAKEEVAELLTSPELSITVRRRLFEAYERFEIYDSMMFPITFRTDMGEGDPVEAHRISPEDTSARVTALGAGQPKLRGNALANFSGFLEESWRRNDILWGRLDGSERLITILLPGHDKETLAKRADLIERAHREIVVEWLTLDEEAAKRWEEHLRHHLATDVVPQPKPDLIVRSLGRAVLVTGKILDHSDDRKGPLWALKLAGRFMWGLAEMAVPQTPMGHLRNHWLRMLLLISALWVGIAVLFTDERLLGLGLTVFAALALAWLAKEYLAHVSRSRPSLKSIALTAVPFLLIVALLVAAPWVAEAERAAWGVLRSIGLWFAVQLQALR